MWAWPNSSRLSREWPHPLSVQALTQRFLLPLIYSIEVITVCLTAPGAHCLSSSPHYRSVSLWAKPHNTHLGQRWKSYSITSHVTLLSAVVPERFQKEITGRWSELDTLVSFHRGEGVPESFLQINFNVWNISPSQCHSRTENWNASHVPV